MLFVPVGYGLDKKRDYSVPDELIVKVLDRLAEEYQAYPESPKKPKVLITAGFDRTRTKKAGRVIILADVYQEYLARMGVPAQKSLAPEFNTDSEMKEVARWITLNPGIRKVVFFNKSWHIPRSAILFEIHRRRYGLNLQVVWVPIWDWNFKKIIRESVKLISEITGLKPKNFFK